MVISLEDKLFRKLTKQIENISERITIVEIKYSNRTFLMYLESNGFTETTEWSLD